jgi:hypothetical protein
MKLFSLIGYSSSDHKVISAFYIAASKEEAVGKYFLDIAEDNISSTVPTVVDISERALEYAKLVEGAKVK